MADTIVTVDGNSDQINSFSSTLQARLPYQFVTLVDGGEAVRYLQTCQTQPKLLIIDLESQPAGVSIIRNVKSIKPQLPIIVLVPFGDQESPAQIAQIGFYDCLSKPIAFYKLNFSIQQALRLQRMREYISWLERKMVGHIDCHDIIGGSALAQKMASQAQQAASGRKPVWIMGEAGSGKEYLARAIHGSSDRMGKPFVVVNAAVLHEDMAEATLFGQEKELPPHQSHFIFGKIREADGGTLLIKELESLSAPIRKRLMDIVKAGVMTPLGSKQPVKFDVRFIFTARTFEPKGFFADLDTFDIMVPSLRKRPEDVVRLADHFLVMYTASENKYIRRFTEGAREWLINHSWPGNVAQLANVVWRAVIVCDSEEIDVPELQWAQHSRPSYDQSSRQSDERAPKLIDKEGKVKTLRSLEEEAIRYALEQTNGCMTRAARRLGIGRSTLYRKVNEMDIDVYISRANHTTRPMMMASSAERS